MTFPEATPPPLKTPPLNPLEPTIFHEAWWLDAATNRSHSFAEVSDKNGRVVGRLPYEIRTRWGIPYSPMPELTHFLGPAVDEGVGSLPRRTLRRWEITRELISQLPQLSSIRIKCHRGTQEILPFQEAQFRTFVQFTHELAPGPEATLWNGMRDKTRNVIRRSREQFEPRTVTEPDAFLDFYARSLDSRGLTNYLDRSRCRAVISESLERGRGRILAIHHKDQSIRAAIFYVWDRAVAYYLMSARLPNSHNGDIPLLAWTAILHASQQRLVFDFDGITNKGAALLYVGFGAKARPRYVVWKTNALTRAIAALREVSSPNSYNA